MTYTPILDFSSDGRHDGRFVTGFAPVREVARRGRRYVGFRGHPNLSRVLVPILAAWWCIQSGAPCELEPGDPISCSMSEIVATLPAVEHKAMLFFFRTTTN